jgi:hypothetical protein
LNATILPYFRNRVVAVQVTRSRPCHSNDNADVEQKNRTQVRKFIGYDRIADIELVELLNAACGAWSLWRNLYRPSSKLLGKERQGSRVIKKHEPKPLNLAQRVLDCAQITPATRSKIDAMQCPMTLWDTIQGHFRSPGDAVESGVGCSSIGGIRSALVYFTCTLRV